MALTPLLFRWHRRLALLVCLPVILWAVSGLLHPVMSRLSPPAAAFSPPRAILPDNALDPEGVLARAGIREASQLRVVELGGPVYQVKEPWRYGPRYFNALTGKEITDGDAQLARRLAVHFSGRPAGDLLKLRRVDEFDAEYGPVNRLLPVWRADFRDADRLSVYVETQPARAAALINDTKRISTIVFQTLHTWRFLPDGPLKTQVMAVLLTLTLLAVLGGATLFLMRRHATARPGARTHRLTGLAATLAALAFSGSGLYHLLHSHAHPQPEAYEPPAFPVAVLRGLSAHAVFGHDARQPVLACLGQPCRLSEPAPARPGVHRHHDGTAPPDGEFRLLRLTDGVVPAVADVFLKTARDALDPQHQTAALKSVHVVTAFGGEYGFLNKRLPVLRFDFDTPYHTSVYLEPSSRAVAAVVRDCDRREGYAFGYLHKYHWLDAAGKDVRDSIMAVMAMLLALTALFGLRLRWRR